MWRVGFNYLSIYPKGSLGQEERNRQVATGIQRAVVKRTEEDGQFLVLSLILYVYSLIYQSSNVTCFDDQNDAVSALKRARQQYVQRCEDLEKAKAMTAKAEEDTGGYKTLDKRRKSRDDAQTKVIPSIWLIL